MTPISVPVNVIRLTDEELGIVQQALMRDAGVWHAAERAWRDDRISEPKAREQNERDCRVKKEVIDKLLRKFQGL